MKFKFSFIGRLKPYPTDVFVKGEKMKHYDITIIGAGPAGTT